MRGNAKGSPSRKTNVDVENRIARIKAFEQLAGTQQPVPQEVMRNAVGPELWDSHWQRLDNLGRLMDDAQTQSIEIERRLTAAFEEGLLKSSN